MAFDGKITKLVWDRLVERAKDSALEFGFESEEEAVARTVGCSKYDAHLWGIRAYTNSPICTKVYREKIRELLAIPSEKEVSVVTGLLTSPHYWEQLSQSSIEAIQEAMAVGLAFRQRKEMVEAGKKRVDEINAEIRRLQQERETVLKSIDL